MRELQLDECPIAPAREHDPWIPEGPRTSALPWMSANSSVGPWRRIRDEVLEACRSRHLSSPSLRAIPSRLQWDLSEADEAAYKRPHSSDGQQRSAGRHDSRRRPRSRGAGQDGRAGPPSVAPRATLRSSIGVAVARAGLDPRGLRDGRPRGLPPSRPSIVGRGAHWAICTPLSRGWPSDGSTSHWSDSTFTSTLDFSGVWTSLDEEFAKLRLLPAARDAALRLGKRRRSRA